MSPASAESGFSSSKRPSLFWSSKRRSPACERPNTADAVFLPLSHSMPLVIRPVTFECALA